MRIFLLVVLMSSIIACTTSEHQVSNAITEQKEFIVPADWKRIDSLGVEFRIPPDFNEKKLRQMLQPSDGKFYGNENVWLAIVFYHFLKAVRSIQSSVIFIWKKLLLMENKEKFLLLLELICKTKLKAKIMWRF